MSITSRVRADRPILAAAALGAGLTVLVTVNPLVHFAYDNLLLHVALETGEGLIGALLAYLAVQRFRAEGLARDLLLAWTFSLLAATNLVLSAIPLVTLGARPVGALTWAVAALRLFGAAGLCGAALAPVGTAPRGRRPVLALAAVTCGVLAAVALFSAVAGTMFSYAVDPSLSPESSGRPRVVGHPVVLVLQAIGIVAYGTAAAGFRRQARSVEDPLLGWLAAGAVLAAFARVNFLLFPSLYSNWVYTGDVLRLGSYLLFLVGAGRQIDRYRRRQMDVAVLGERQRVARELHDGLVQELTFIRSQTAAMAGGAQVPGMAGYLSAAAERALNESRRVIEALADTERRPLAEALRAAADDVAARAGGKVEIDVRASPVVPADVQASLVRVVREAVTNAVRHGKANVVRLTLSVDDKSLGITIADDGCGFDLHQPSTGFGMRSMRERAESLGGALEIHSGPEKGTVVELTVPMSRRGG